MLVYLKMLLTGKVFFQKIQNEIEKKYFVWLDAILYFISIKNLLEEKDAATAILRIYHHNIKQSHVIIALYLTNQSYNKPTQLFKRFYHIIKQFISL